MERRSLFFELPPETALTGAEGIGAFIDRRIALPEHSQILFNAVAEVVRFWLAALFQQFVALLLVKAEGRWVSIGQWLIQKCRVKDETCDIGPEFDRAGERIPIEVSFKWLWIRHRDQFLHFLLAEHGLHHAEKLKGASDITIDNKAVQLFGNMIGMQYQCSLIAADFKVEWLNR